MSEQHIPNGYKQTKVGVVPENWDIYRIDKVLHRIRKKVDVEQETLYRQIGIRSHSKGIFHKEAVTGEILGNKSVFWIEENCFIVNIVFAWEQAVAKTTSSEKGMIASHRFPMYQPKDNKSDIDYILYFFKSKRGKYFLGLASPGGAGRNKTLGQKEFSELKIPLPPLKEQQKIAEILTTWDDAISKQEKLIKAKERLKKSLMQKLLSGDVRFSEFDEEWEYKKIGDIFNISAGGDIKKEHVSISKNKLFKYPIFANSDKNNGLYGYSDIYKIDKECVTVTGRGSLGIAKARFGNFFPIVRLLVLIGKIPTNYKFYENAINELNFFVESTGVPQLTGPQISSYKIVYPIIQEQQKIARVLTTADKEIELLKKELESLKEQKKGLMQRLLSGEIRVSI